MLSFALLCEEWPPEKAVLQGRMATYYVSSYYQVCQRHYPQTPKLTEKQHAAFAAFDEIASRPDIAMNWVLKEGDMQFLQNHLVVHNRSAFQDHEVSASQMLIKAV